MTTKNLVRTITQWGFDVYKCGNCVTTQMTADAERNFKNYTMIASGMNASGNRTEVWERKPR